MDVKIDVVDKFSDKRGDLVVFLKSSDLAIKEKQFGQIYFVTFQRKGEVRGNHYHDNLREWFCVVAGRLKVYLKDVDTNEEKICEMNSKDDKYIRMEIGPRVAHTFVSITKFAALLNYTNKLWSPKDVYEKKLV